MIFINRHHSPHSAFSFHRCEKCGWVCDDCARLCSAHAVRIERVSLRDRIEPKLKEAFESTGWKLVDGGLIVDVAEGSVEFQVESEKRV